MMASFAAILTAGLAVLALVSIANALTAPRLLPARGVQAGRARTSVLIPARNEGVALPATLNSLVRHAPRNVEILVLDDESTDGTAAVARQFEFATEGRVRLLRGQPLPPGWLGKNWACHQLAEAAHGELLIFCDADVVLTGDAVSATEACLAEAGADALSALPAQRYTGWWDRAVIPLVLHFPLLATLPLRLVQHARSAAVVFGNGQWLAVRRATYQAAGGHERVRGSVVEDMALAAALKRDGFRVVAALGTELLAVRMYRTFDQLAQGFGKNLYPLLGGRVLLATAALASFLALTVGPLLLAFAGAWLPLAVLAGIRLLHLRLTRGGLPELLLHPVGALLAAWVALGSMAAHRTGRVRWKARLITGVEEAA